MQKERLIVKNFFTLKDIDIELSKYNVFIGEQASGKSLLIKLIYACRKILSLPVEQNGRTTSEIENFIKQYFYELFNLSDASLAEYQIEYHLNSKFSVSISLKNQIFSIVFSKPLQEIFNRYKEKSKLLSDQSNKKFGSDDMQRPKDALRTYLDVRREIGLDNSTSQFITAGRTFIVTFYRNIFQIINSMTHNSMIQDSSFDKLLLDLGQQYINGLDSFSKVDLISKVTRVKPEDIKWYDKKFANILKGDFIYDPIGGFIKQNSGTVRPWHSSSGQQESLPIYLVVRNYLLRNKPGGHLYIEEPEAHLYPTAQKDMLELLVYVANATSSQGLYITTHSPYILTVLNNLIMANEVRDKQNTFEPNLLVPFEEVRAYFIADGKANSLMNEEYRIIDAEKLDEVSNSISREYSEMVDLL